METATDQVRDVRLNIYLTPDERSQIKSAAHREEKSMAAYIRDIVLPQAEKDLED